MKFGKFFKKYGTYILVLGIVIYVLWFRDKSPLSTFKTWDVIFAVIFFGWLSSQGFIDSCKLNSHSVQTPSMHFSLGEAPFTFIFGGMEWMLFRLGGSTHIVPFKGDDGVIVVPKNLVEEKGGEYSIHAIALPVGIKNLPLPAIRYIQHYNLDEPYFFCVMPLSAVGLKEFKYSLADLKESYDHLFEAVNKLNNQQNELINSDLESLDKFNQKVANYSASMNKGPSILDRLKGGGSV